MIKDDVERADRAMKERAAQPLGNIPSLEPVLVGSLGDARVVLVRAALLAFFSSSEPDEELVEEGAKAMYDDMHRHMKNCWAWDDSGLDDEHPGTRERFRKQFRAALMAADRWRKMKLEEPDLT